MNFKQPVWKCKKWIAAARDQRCTMSLNGCNGNRETTVFAHCPGWLNKMLGGMPIGGGMKADAHNGVDACSNCHDVMDERHHALTMAEREAIAEKFVDARYQTIVNRLERGIVK